MKSGPVAFGYSSGGPISQTVEQSEPLFYGIYTNLSGSLTKVTATGDLLDDRLVQAAQLGRQGLEGNQILIEVSFTDGTQALYVATPIPEPGSLMLLASGCLVLVVMLRFRTQRLQRRGKSIASSRFARICFAKWSTKKCPEPIVVTALRSFSVYSRQDRGPAPSGAIRRSCDRRNESRQLECRN